MEDTITWFPPLSSSDPAADCTTTDSWCSVPPSTQRTSTVPVNDTRAAASRARSKGSSTAEAATPAPAPVVTATDVANRPATRPVTSAFIVGWTRGPRPAPGR